MEELTHIGLQRRTQLRASVQLPAMFLTPKLVGNGVIQDASRKGLRIETREPVSQGMAFAIQVYFPKEPKPLEIEEAVVQWTKGTQFGVRFTKLNVEALPRLDSFYVLALEEQLQSLAEFLRALSPPTSALEWLRRSGRTHTSLSM
jgi:PilZ domain